MSNNFILLKRLIVGVASVCFLGFLLLFLFVGSLFGGGIYFFYSLILQTVPPILNLALTFFAVYVISHKYTLSMLSKILLFIAISFILGINTNIPLFIENNILNRPKVEKFIGEKVTLPISGGKYIIRSHNSDHSNCIPSAYYLSPYVFYSAGSEAGDKIGLSNYIEDKIVRLEGNNYWRYMKDKKIDLLFDKNKNKQRIVVFNTEGYKERFTNFDRRWISGLDEKEILPEYLIVIRQNQLHDNKYQLEIYITDRDGYIVSWLKKSSFTAFNTNTIKDYDFDRNYSFESSLNIFLHNNIWSYILNQIDPYQNTKDIMEFLDEATSEKFNYTPEPQENSNNDEYFNTVYVIFDAIWTHRLVYMELPWSNERVVAMPANSQPIKNMMEKISINENRWNPQLLPEIYVTYYGDYFAICYKPKSEVVKKYEVTRYTIDGKVDGDFDNYKCIDQYTNNCFRCLRSVEGY